MRRDEKKSPSMTVASKRGEKALKKEREEMADMIQTASRIIMGKDVFPPAEAKGREKSALVPFLWGCLFSACVCTALFLIL